MRKEIEVKAMVEDPIGLMRTLSAKGCDFSAPILQEDAVFVHASDPFPGGPGINFLRIRKNAGRVIFTLKQSRSNGLDKIEHEVTVDDADELEKMIVMMGYRRVSFIKKERQKATYQDYEICIDKVDKLGSFVEMEKIAEDVDSGKVQDEMFAFLVGCGVRPEDRVLYGYDVLMHQREEGLRDQDHA